MDTLSEAHHKLAMTFFDSSRQTTLKVVHDDLAYCAKSKHSSKRNI